MNLYLGVKALPTLKVLATITSPALWFLLRTLLTMTLSYLVTVPAAANLRMAARLAGAALATNALNTLTYPLDS
jgi:hypothetical protein